MYVGGIPVLLVTMFLAVGAERFQDDTYLSILNCVATSADNNLCGDFIYCTDSLPQPFLDAVGDCEQELAPDGPFDCTEDEQLYGDEENRKAVIYAQGSIRIY
ncbi:hypothetical protein TNIN_344711 [Trichonephila inaurata madagascariensis]|uniref:Uncharacterized protein n=1 Tax=Trichonephila inaurata madagascariensis TaxID=2747483 RepID=A0A8X6YCJ2_9ARAC|nr:hypothetical protein TNIN_344711 [Trichonephila inaurata madagascariensis]